MDAVLDVITEVTPEALPGEVRDRACDAITDCIGVALAGSRTAAADASLLAVNDLEGRPGDSAPTRGPGRLAIGRSVRLSPMSAALFNGTVAHALDFDDTLLVARSHVTSHLLPILLEAAQSDKPTGRQLVAAYVVGLEVEAMIGESLGLRLQVPSLHPTGALGALGACATRAYLLNLSRTQTAMALGIAASAAGGLWCNLGTMTKPLHAGYAARSGLLAGSLAAHGFTSSPDSLTRSGGLLDVLMPGRATDSWRSALEGHWHLADSYGLALKPYPSCSLTHAAVDAALRLRTEVADISEIVSVLVKTSEMAPQFLVFPQPKNELEAKFSMEFCVATAIVRGSLTNEHFGETGLRDHTVGALARSTRMIVDQGRIGDKNDGAEVTLTLSSGEVSSVVVDTASGMPTTWMSRDALWNKFLQCSSHAETSATCQLFDAATNLWKASDATVILESLPNVEGTDGTG